MRNYYAFEHAYGEQVQDSNGDDIGDVHQFTTKAERDAWVDDGPAYSTQQGYRTVYTARKAHKWPADSVIQHVPAIV